ncbi:MAG: polyprenyl synthetase family protein [Oscillospiraceae bacterium]|nr:polyprenyl synthetase family protein [Oscillospiraceae bacterium]
MKPELRAIFQNDVEVVDQYLYNNGYLSKSEDEDKKVIDAEYYALTAGGKRIRPVLCIEFYKLFGGKGDVTEIAACLELMHTFSLIHDDMPEMDNDDMRRGKPSVHCAYGVDTALLAGDGLAILPFEIISDKALSGDISTEIAVRLINCLSKAAGNQGMIMGQRLDLISEGKQVDLKFLKRMSALKTGCILSASAQFGAILAEADDEDVRKAAEYAENVGLSFQIIDDILDITGSEAELGKPIGSDEKRNKDTYATILGVDEAYSEAKRYTEAAVSAISGMGGSELLIELAYDLLDRKH